MGKVLTKEDGEVAPAVLAIMVTTVLATGGVLLVASGVVAALLFVLGFGITMGVGLYREHKRQVRR
jgi:hypothetical protein